MIVDGLFGLIVAALKAVVDLLPTVSYTDSSWAAGAGDALRFGRGLDSVLPLEATFACLSIALAYVSASWVYQGVMWTWRHIPFVGGG